MKPEQQEEDGLVIKDCQLFARGRGTGNIGLPMDCKRKMDW